MPIRTKKQKRIKKFVKSFKSLSKVEKGLVVGTIGATVVAGAPGLALGTAILALSRTTKVPTTKRKKIKTKTRRRKR